LANRYQFDFVFKKDPVFNDCRKILLAFVEGNMSISTSDEEKIVTLVKEFLPLFFFASDLGEETADEANAEQVTQEQGDEPVDPAVSQQTMDSIPAPASTSEMEIDDPAQMDDGSPAQEDEVAATSEGQVPLRKRTAYSFYGNTSLYAFFRLYQVLGLTRC
jgi:histone deacetylase complex regulatory component SIN3